MTRAYISLGSNLGDRERTLNEAIRELKGSEGIAVLKASTFIETDPVGRTDQPKFVNSVVEIETSLDPQTLLNRLETIEGRLGRRREVRWGPRTIDLDIVLFGHLTLCTDRLTIPHPEMAKRRFVLEPLFELAPDLTVPGGKGIRQLLEEVRS